MNADDPIIAVIEAHRRAYAETRAAYERLSVVKLNSWQGLECRQAWQKMIHGGLLPMMQRETRWLCRMTS